MGCRESSQTLPRFQRENTSAAAATAAGRRGEDRILSTLGLGGLFSFERWCLFGSAQAMCPVSSHCACSCLQLLPPELDGGSFPSRCPGQDGPGAPGSATAPPAVPPRMGSCCPPHAVRRGTGRAGHCRQNRRDPKRACEQSLCAARQLGARWSVEAAAGLQRTKSPSPWHGTSRAGPCLRVQSRRGHIHRRVPRSGTGQEVGAGCWQPPREAAERLLAAGSAPLSVGRLCWELRLHGTSRKSTVNVCVELHRGVVGLFQASVLSREPRAGWALRSCCRG